MSSELTSFLLDVSILIILGCDAISISALKFRIEELEQQIDRLTERESE